MSIIRKSFISLFALVFMVSAGVVFAQSHNIQIKKTSMCKNTWTAVWSADLTVDFGVHNGNYPLSNLTGKFADLRNFIQQGCDVKVVISSGNQIGVYQCGSASANQTDFSCSYGGHEKEEFNGTSYVFNPMLFIWNPFINGVQGPDAALWTKASSSSGDETNFVPSSLHSVVGSAQITVWIRK